MASRPQPLSVLAGIALLVLGSLFAGCGRSVGPAEPGAEAPSSALSPKSASAAETLDQAEAELEQARLELAQLGGGLSAPAGAAAGAPAAAPPPSPVTPTAESAKKRSSADEAPSAPAASQAPSRKEKDQAESEGSPYDSKGNSCETTCKAFASLLRAKSAVCRLDAPNGARCARAEGIVRDATAQVQSCQCAN